MQFLTKALLFYPFFFLLLFFSNNTLAQKAAEIDSLKNLLSDTQDTAQIHLRQKLSMSYQNYVPDSALMYAEQALSLSNMLHYDQGKADAQLQIGRLKRDQGEFANALEDMFAAQKLYVELKDSVQLANTYNDISIVYGISGELETSRAYFEKALHLFRLNGDKKGESYALNNIGAIYEEEGALEKAREYYQASMVIKLQRNDGYGISRGYKTLGDLESNQKNHQKALQYFFRADSMFVILKDEIARSNNLSSIAQTYLALGKLTQARSFAEQSYAIAQQLHSNRFLESSLRILASVSAAQKDFAHAYEYQVLHEAINDSLHQETKENHLAELKAKFDNEQQKAEIELLKQEKLLQEASLSQQRSTIVSLIVGLLIIIGFSIALYLANKRNKQKNKLLAAKNDEIHHQTIAISEQMHRLDQLNQTKDKLFSIVSHDIRSPLNTLKGFSYLLAQEIHVMSKNEMQEMSRKINIALDNLSQLLDNLLNWSLMQTGNKKLEFSTININELIDFNIELYEATAAEKGIQLINTSDQQVYAYADYQSINTVIRNLLSNSIKFSYPNSSISIIAQNQKNTVEVAIMDQGVGMSEEVLNRIFSIDKKESQKGTRNETGSGFGLTLCHELIQHNFGEIRVSSKLKEGSTFSFYLPIGKAKEVKEALQ